MPAFRLWQERPHEGPTKAEQREGQLTRRGSAPHSHAPSSPDPDTGFKPAQSSRPSDMQRANSPKRSACEILDHLQQHIGMRRESRVNRRGAGSVSGRFKHRITIEPVIRLHVWRERQAHGGGRRRERLAAGRVHLQHDVDTLMAFETDAVADLELGRGGREADRGCGVKRMRGPPATSPRTIPR